MDADADVTRAQIEEMRARILAAPSAGEVVADAYRESMEPYAAITRERGWLLRWSVVVRHDFGLWGPNGGSSYCFTRHGAERTARSMLRRYLKSREPKPTTRITVADLGDERG